MLHLKNTLKYSVSTASVLAIIGMAQTAYADDSKEVIKAKDGSYVSLSGTVGKIIDDDEFNLITSSGTVKIDTNDHWPSLISEETTKYINTGDKITVVGEVDDNYFTKKEIDATNITFNSDGYTTTYYLYDKDYDPTIWYWYYDLNNYDDTNLRLTGTVSKVINDEEFVLNYTGGSIQVDIGDVNIDDNYKVLVGDRVTVYGEIENDWFEKKELEANYLYRTKIYPPRV